VAKIAIILTVLVVIGLTLASIPPAYCQNVTVTLSAEPMECVLKLIGQGEYPIGSEVTIEVKVKPECRFVKWEIIKGLGVREVAVNPFTFYPQEDFEAKAILEPLYEKPGGGVVERVVVRIQANATGLQLPEPMIVKKGEQVLVPLPSEQVVGDLKYTFLYAEDTLGNKYYDPEVKLVANQSLTVIGYYAAFKRFLNEYYPLDSFRRVQISPIYESEGVRLYPTGFSIANKTFPLNTEVPVQLLNLVEPIYERQVRVAISIIGSDQPIELEVLGTPVVVNDGKQLWVKAGSQISIEAPKDFKGYELEKVEPPITVNGGHLIANASQPLLITLYYKKSEIAFLLDIPLIGAPFFYFVRFTGGIIGVKGLPALIFAITAFIIAPCGVGVAALITMRRGAARKIVRATAAEKGLELMVESISNPRAPTRVEVEEALGAKGPLNLSEELRGVIESSFGHPSPAPNPTTVEPEAELAPIEEAVLESDAEAAFQEVVRGRASELDVQHLFHLKLDEERYNLLVAALSRGLRLTGEVGYFGFDNQAMRLIELLADPSTPFFALVCEDGELARRILNKAAEEIGMRVAYVGELAGSNPRLIAKSLSKAAAQSRASAVALFGLTRSIEEVVVRSIPLLEVKTILITKSAWVRPNVVLGGLNPERYVRFAVALLARNGLIGYVDWRRLEKLGRLASACRGIRTVERFIEILHECGDVERALNELTVEELSIVFRPEELRLLLSARRVEELREAYMSLIRQLSPGSDPVREWSNFYERLKRMGVVEAGGE